jgi:tRNA dimethylallyltransferase
MKLTSVLEDSLLIVSGPTASGKTAVGIALAAALNGEIISADSRQIFRYMNIGTAKPTSEERSAAPHHLLDIVDPDESYSAAQFAKDAAKVIQDMQDRDRVPILVGGSGFYLAALIDGFSPIPGIPEQIRSELMSKAESRLPELFARLGEVDPALAERLHPNDTQRIVRGLEVYEATGEALTDLQKIPRERAGEWPVHWYALEVERQALYSGIDRRVDWMIARGLVEEVRQLKANGYGPELDAMNTFGYREVYQHIGGELTLEEARDQIKTGTRHYAKRQLTWFRKNDRINWVDNLEGTAPETILKSLDTSKSSR